jgi:hypothetical protein
MDERAAAKRDEADIMEAVVRHMLRHAPPYRPARHVFFLGPGVMKARPDLLQELRLEGHRVLPASRAQQWRSPAGVVDLNKGLMDTVTGERGVLLDVRSVRVAGRHGAVTEGSYTVSGRSGLMLRYYLVRTSPGWVVTNQRVTAQA